MVAFLTKTKGNDDFADIVDFLNASSIKYSLNDVEQVVIVAAEVVNAGVSVSTAEPKTPPTTTTTLLEDDDVTVAATLVQMSETSKAKSIDLKMWRNWLWNKESRDQWLKKMFPPQR
ncbi:hypothetical protein Tco_1376030 [Tanacetum coccineum]